MSLLLEDTRDLTTDNLLRRLVATRADHVFIRSGDRAITYGAADILTARISNGLAKLGFGKGDHVALMMGNSPEILLTLLALGRIGAVAVPLNVAARGEQLRYFLDQSESVGIVIDASLVQRLDEALPADDPRLRIVFDDPDSGSGGLPLSRQQDHAFATLLAAPAELPCVDVAFNDTAFLLYTSGTTGPSKACIYTQAHALHWSAAFARAFRYQPDDVMYISLPLFHVNAMHSAAYATMLVGGTVAIARRFSASGFWPDIVRYRATLTNLLGSMGDILWKLEPTEAERDNTLRQWMMAPVPSYARDAMCRYRIDRVTNGYGLTDFGVTNFYGPDDPCEKLGSVGKPTDAFDVRVVDPLDFPVPPGTIGEIVLRNREPWHGTSGYFRMAEKTVESRRNLWFHTGDQGYFDADGYLYFTDRMKDSIRRRGENVSAFEVEQVLMQHPAVSEACVHAVSVDNDEEVGATLVASTVGAIDERALVEWCNKRMAYFMVPRFIRIVDALPRNASEKIEKHRLRDAMQAQRDQIWDRERAGVRLMR